MRLNFLFLLSPLLPLLFLVGDGERAFLTRDVSLAYLPAKKFWVDSFLSTHGVPGWNPLAYGGVPFRADLNLSPLHPLNFLFLLFPQSIDKGYLLFLGAHLLLLALGTYLLFRRFRMGKEGALIATLIFSLSGVSFSTMNLMNIAASLPALPFFLFFLLDLRKNFSWGKLVGMATAWAWPIYSGDPQFSYWMALAALLLVGKRCYQERSVWSIARTFPAVLLALGLSAAQFLPALSLAASSERGLGAHSLAAAERFSLHPLRILDLFLPLPFGNPGNGTGHWMGKLAEAIFTMPFLLHLYVGVVAGGFIFFQAARLFRRPSKRNLLFVGTIAVLIAAALGRYSFLNLYGLFFYVIPGWKLFRYPERLSIMAILCLFLWAAPLFRYLAGRLRSPVSEAKNNYLRIARLLTVLAILLFILHRATPILEVVTLTASLMHVSLLTALFFLFWHFRARFARVRKFALPIFCVLLVADQLPFGFLLLWRTSAHEVSFRSNEFAQKIQRHLAGRAEEIRKGAATRYFHGTYSGSFPTSGLNPLTKAQAWDWGLMYPNIPMYFGLASPAGYSPFDPKEILGLWEKYGRSDPQRLITLFSVAYFPLANGGEKPSLQYNPKSLPQAWLPASVSLLPKREEAEARLFGKDFPYPTKAVMSGETEEWKQSGKEWSIQSFSRTPDHARVELLPQSAETVFVWNERRNPNWHAYWGGERIEIAEANTWAMGVRLPARTGTTLLEFFYEDQAAINGNRITLLTLLGIILASAGIRFRSCRRKPR